MSEFHQLHNSIGDLVFNTREYGQFIYPAHIHKSYELLYAVKKETKCSVDGKEITLRQGQFLLIFPYQIHAFSIPHGGELFVVVFSESLVKSFTKSTAGRIGNAEAFQCTEATEAFFCEQLMKKFRTCFKKPSEIETLSIKACLYAVCFDFLERVELVKHTGVDNSAILMQVLDYTSRRFTENISLRSISVELGYSYPYVSKVFSNKIQTNFKTVLNQYRYEYAKQLLNETDKSMTEIAMESGFQSIRNFNLVFSSFAGKTPRQFRLEGG